MENSIFKIHISNIQATSASIGLVQDLGEVIEPSEIRWYPSGEEYDFHIVDGSEYTLNDVLESNEGTLQFTAEYNMEEFDIDDIVDSVGEIVSDYNLEDEIEIDVTGQPGSFDFDENNVEEVPYVLERLQELTGARAIAWWTKEDIMDRYEISDEEAEEWITDHEEDLQEVMISAGWEYISNNIN